MLATSTRPPKASTLLLSKVRMTALSSTTSTRLSVIGERASTRALASAARPKRAVKLKQEPLPGVLSTVMVPPMCSTSCLLIARPRPVPPYFRVVEVSA